MNNKPDCCATNDARVADLLNLLERMAGGDYSIRLPLSPLNDSLDALAFGINVLADEVDYRQRDQRRQTEELKSMQAQLIQSAKLAALGQICAGIAHEINNPLTVIRAYIEHIQILLSEAGPIDKEQISRDLVKINKGVDRVVGIVNNVRSFSHQASDRLEAMTLNTLIEASLTLFGNQFKQFHIDILKSVDRDIKISCNSSHIEQVLVNVLANAKDAILMLADRAGGRIHIEAGTDRQSHWVEISDNGSGLAPDLIDKVFDPFFTTKEVGKGTGLGLSISHGIMRAHGGTISFASVLGHGSKVRLEFPIPQDE